MTTRLHRRRTLPFAVAVLAAAVALPLVTMGPASAATRSTARSSSSTSWHDATLRHAGLNGTTTVTTAPGIAKALLDARRPAAPGRARHESAGHPALTRSRSPTASRSPAASRTWPARAATSTTPAGSTSPPARPTWRSASSTSTWPRARSSPARSTTPPARIPVLDLDLSGLKVTTTPRPHRPVRHRRPARPRRRGGPERDLRSRPADRRQPGLRHGAGGPAHLTSRSLVGSHKGGGADPPRILVVPGLRRRRWPAAILGVVPERAPAFGDDPFSRASSVRLEAPLCPAGRAARCSFAQPAPRPLARVLVV